MLAGLDEDQEPGSNVGQETPWTTTKERGMDIDYRDQEGERTIRTFDRKKEAEAFETTMQV